MPEFLELIGQIFLIVCIGSILEFFIDQAQKPFLSKLVNIASYAASFYLVLRFVFDHLIKEVLDVMKFTL